MCSTRLTVVLAAFLIAGPAWGQAVPSREPTSTHIFPAGGKRGTVVKARVGGECLPPGMNFKFFGDGLTASSVLGPEVKARYEPSLRRLPRDADAAGASMTYPREFDASVTIAADAEPGVRFWRVSGGWGGTRLRPFLVGDLSEFIETEPNSHAELAERVALPVVVNGQIAGERDQDFFVFSATAGKVVTCDVMASRIGSPLEPAIALTDGKGRRIEYDESRIGGDPVVSFRAAATGDYRLHIANLGYGGGPAYVYRISVTTDPYVFPPKAQGRPSLGFADNHTPDTAMELTVPVAVNSRFLKAEAEDWYRLSAKKDEAFTIACRPFPHDSAAVPQLTLLNANDVSSIKASNVERPELGFAIDWKAPADGIYRLRLRDLQHGSRGGPEFAYRLTVRPAQPDFSLRLEADSINVVQAGKTEIDLLVERTGGFTGPIDLDATGLPDNVKFEPARIADNQTRVKLSVSAKDDARPAEAVVRLQGKATIAGKAIERRAVVPSFGWEGDALHLTVQHKPVFRLSCNEAYQYAHRGSIYPYLMKIERLDGFDGPIVLQLCDRQVQDLDGIDIVETVIPPNAKEFGNLIYLPESMHASVQHHSRPYAQAYATFTDKWGQKQTLLAVSTHRCMIRTLPPVVKLRAVTKTIAARPGDVVECKVALDRVSTFTGPVEVVMAEAAGFKANRVRIDAGQTDAVLRIQLGYDLSLLGDSELTFRAIGKLASGATAVTEATVSVSLVKPDVPHGEPADEARAVKAIFAKHCVACHGPTKQKAGLRLDAVTMALHGSDGGAIVVAGKANDSLIVKALTGAKGVTAMPPEGRPRPTAADIATIKRWIDRGAPAIKDEVVADVAKSDHWAFQPIKRSESPVVKERAWVRNPIDAFILARLEKEKLTPSKDADRVTLLRRASLDLTGLPPTPAEVAAFVADQSPDAYDRVVERLLKSPHYGERWARHWLDLARYADSNGFTIDGPRTIWPYRDWVIQSLNRDQPVDQFIVEQLAGDMLPKATVPQKVATGFHRNTLLNQEGGIDLEMFRVEYVIDRVGTTGSVFLGLTVGCAQCHDHKYDPISQGEFYKMFAFFNNCDEPTLSVPTPEQKKALAAVKAREAELVGALKAFNTTSDVQQKKWEESLSPADRVKLFEKAPRIRELIDKPEYQRTKKESDELKTFLRQADQIPQLLANLGDSLPGGFGSIGGFVSHAHVFQYRANVEKQLADLRSKKPAVATTLVMQERKTPRDTHFLVKGDFTRKGRKIAPGTPATLPPMKAVAASNRLDFARWVADPANPLTPRVFVNRVWQTYFGVGLVETENDFGLQGTPPSHPELLDWLADEFIARNWSLKDLHRLIVSSSTYRQASVHRPDLAKVDPRNRLLGRQNRLRLEAEVVRDVALSASGLLNPKTGGPSVFPPQPDGVFAFTQTQRVWKADTDDDRYRRGLYTYFWRSAPHPGLMAFDAPDANTACTRRNRSNTPLQALTLLNDKAYVEFAQALAARVLREAKGDDADKLRFVFRLCLAREPNVPELDRLQTLLSLLQGEMADTNAVWTQISRTLLNLDEFITRE